MNIITIPNKILTKKADTVKLEKIKDGSLKDLVVEMKIAMKNNKGIGLAANQIGQNLSIFVIEPELAAEHKVPDVYINPEITEYSRETGDMEEGCLSIPEYFISIRRSKKIKIKALDENGKKIKIKAKGLLARVFQHETDHLNGITIKDHD